MMKLKTNTEVLMELLRRWQNGDVSNLILRRDLSGMAANADLRESEFEKLVRYVKIYGAYVKAWMKHVKEDAEYPDFHPVQVAWEALSGETRKAVQNDPQT